MYRFVWWGTLSACCTIFLLARGIETGTTLSESTGERDDEVALQEVLREDDFEVCELSLDEFFGEVDTAEEVTRGQIVPSSGLSKALMPVAIYFALWYERLEKATRYAVVTACRVAEKILGCQE